MCPAVPQQFSSYEELPPNAIKLSKMEVLKYQVQRIEKWEPKSEMWPFRYQHHIIAGSSVITGLILDNQMRKFFMIGNFKPLNSLVPTLLAPAGFGMLLFGIAVSRNIIYGQATCISCYSIKGGSIHAAVSTGYALFLSILGCHLLARQYHTYGGRYKRNQVELLKSLKVPKHALPLLGTLAAGNYLIGAYLAYKQVTVFDDLLNKPPNRSEMS